MKGIEEYIKKNLENQNQNQINNCLDTSNNKLRTCKLDDLDVAMKREHKERNGNYFDISRK